MPIAHTSGISVPAARVDNLVMTESGTEVLVYDQRVHHIHHLNELAATVWRLCDGNRGVRDIAVAATDGIGSAVSEDAVKLALRKLADADLIEGALAPELRGTSRRSFMKKAAIAGAVMPMIASMTATDAAAKTSSNCVESGDPCRNDNQCCAGTVCSTGTCTATP